MVYCTHCDDYCPYIKDPDKGYICCGTCGKVLDQEVYGDDPTFVKDGSGQSRLAGNILNSIESGSSLSHERTLMKGRDEIWLIAQALQVSGRDSIVDMAHKFYTLAVDHNFTRGRRTTLVASACVYIACRQAKRAYLLIDFSDYLKISVYVLGAVFLQLCQVLLLADHPIVQKLIDPSLFIHRFTERLLGKRDNDVSDTALRIVASMKRDWMQTGRKPSGLCGAALYIASLSHGYDYTKADIVAVVHVCEATLTKRLIEFENTDSGSLTIEDFLAKADEEPISNFSPKSGEILCEHKDKGAEHFAHGLCEKCYNEFTKLSGGLEGGADPPAFQRAKKQRLEAAKKAIEVAANKESMLEEPICEIQNSDLEDNNTSPRKGTSGHESPKITSGEDANDYLASKDPEVGGENGKADADPESFSDIDDVEVDGYLHNEEETRYKKIIWEEMNKEYLEEQAAKEALAAELAARGEGVGDSQHKRRRRNRDAKNSAPAETPAEATYNMLKRKGLGSKINVEAVGGLYNTKDENGEANENEEMGFDGEYGNEKEQMGFDGEYGNEKEQMGFDGEYANEEEQIGFDGEYANEKEQMGFDGEYSNYNGYDETFECGYDNYKNGDYGDGNYNDYDDNVDF